MSIDRQWHIVQGHLHDLAAAWLVARLLPELLQAEEGAVVEAGRPGRALGAAGAAEVVAALCLRSLAKFEFGLYVFVESSVVSRSTQLSYLVSATVGARELGSSRAW